MSYQHSKRQATAFRRMPEITMVMVLAIGAGLAGSAVAQTPGPAQASEAPTVFKPTDPLEYGGIVNGQTLTNIGNYFHAKFTEAWSAQPNFDKYVLLVREKLSPRGGTEIQVIENDRLVYRNFLPRNYAAVLGLTESAAESVQQVLVQSAVQNALFNDPDLAVSGY
jgi:hypothetical protein